MLLEEGLNKPGIFVLEKNTPVVDNSCLHSLKGSGLSLGTPDGEVHRCKRERCDSK